jgi:hypothetical protein
MTPLSQVSSAVYVLPAYGRKYMTKESALADWVSGKDFKIANGPYMSVRDATKLDSRIYIDLVTELVRVA